MLKFMTRIITLMLMLLFAALSTVMNADDKGSGNTDDKTAQRIPFYQIGKDLIKDKPRMPARYADIECYYCDGFIYISFDEPEGNASMTIEDVATAEKGIYTFSTLSPYTINIGEVKGTFRLEISTSEGHTYVGYLTE